MSKHNTQRAETLRRSLKTEKGLNLTRIVKNFLEWFKSASPVGSNNVKYIWRGSQSEYEAIEEKRDDTLYIVSNSKLGIAANLGGIAFGEINSFPSATALAAIAMGNAAEANGSASFAVGNGCKAHAPYSAAIGVNSVVNGLQAGFAAGGNGPEASTESIAMGTGAKALETYSVAIGLNTLVNNGGGGIALGANTEITDLGNDSSRAIGLGSLVNNPGQEAFANGFINQKGDAQTSRFIHKRVTTDGDLHLLHQINHPDNTLMAWEGRVIAYEPATGDSASYKVVTHTRKYGGTSTILTETVTVEYEDAGATSWAVDVDFPGTFQIDVTGEAGKTINWLSYLENVKLTE